MTTIEKTFEPLPISCATWNPGGFGKNQQEPVIIWKGVKGYQDAPGLDVDEYNEKRGVTPAQITAMTLGSQWGWQVPGADPATHERIDGKDSESLTYLNDRTNPTKYLNVIWSALHGYREDCISEGNDAHDSEWDKICTAMAWISEDLGESEPAAAPERLDNFDPAGH